MFYIFSPWKFCHRFFQTVGPHVRLPNRLYIDLYSKALEIVVFKNVATHHHGSQRSLTIANWVWPICKHVVPQRPNALKRDALDSERNTDNIASRERVKQKQLYIFCRPDKEAMNYHKLSTHILRFPNIAYLGNKKINYKSRFEWEMYLGLLDQFQVKNQQVWRAQHQFMSRITPPFPIYQNRRKGAAWISTQIWTNNATIYIKNFKLKLSGAQRVALCAHGRAKTLLIQEVSE